MIKSIVNMFELIFMNLRIIDSRLKNFSEDHLKRLSIQNTQNVYDVMINDTETKHIAYYGAIDNKDLVITLKEARTMSTDNKIAQFIDIMRKNDDIIAGLVGRKSDIFHELFPNLLSEYINVTKTNIDTLIHRMVDRLTYHETAFGAQGTQMKNAMIAMQTAYNTARGEQQLKKAGVDAQRTDVKDKRLPLALQLQDNLFDIAKQFKGHPERARDFFTFHMLLPHSHKLPDGTVIYDEQTIAVLKNSQKDSGLLFTPDTVFQFYNDGLIPIIVMLTSVDEDQTVPPNPLIIMPDQLVEKKASEIGPENCLHLRLINQSTTTDGQLTIDILS